MTTTEPSRSKFVRGFIAVTAAVFVICGPFESYSDNAHAQTAPPAFPVTVATPLAKRIKTWDEYSGRFEAVARVELRPRVSGFIEQVNFKEGSDVKEGDLLFTLDKRPFEIAVESAKADIARAKAQVEFAQADVTRAAPLAEIEGLERASLRATQVELGRRRGGGHVGEG